MNRHTAQCDDWADAFRRDPDGTLDAGPEYARWAAAERGRERAADLAAAWPIRCGAGRIRRTGSAATTSWEISDEHDGAVG